jgi:hypothetical protein
MDTLDRPGWQQEAIAAAVDQYKERINRIANGNASQSSLTWVVDQLAKGLLIKARLTPDEVNDLLDRLYETA